MDKMTTLQLRALADAGTPPCVSIYLPTHRVGKETQGDSIRLKNLLKRAEDQFVERGMMPMIARDMLEPARRLLDDPNAWL